MSDTQTIPMESDAQIALCAADVLEFDGQTFRPDDTKGYFQFSFSHAFPVRNAYGLGIAPAVIAAHYKSLLHQQINWEHLLQVYHKKPGERTHVTDRIIGNVVAVKFPEAPFGGWKITTDASKAPGITAVGVIFKHAQGVDRIIGDHLGGRHKYSVSLEVEYDLQQAGFAVPLKGDAPKFAFTPQDMLEAGFEYIPYASAPEDLRECFSKARNRVVRDWKQRQVTLMPGGLNAPIHYAGVGTVKYGAESAAKINRMTASATPDFAAPFAGLKDLLKKSLT